MYKPNFVRVDIQVHQFTRVVDFRVTGDLIRVNSNNQLKIQKKEKLWIKKLEAKIITRP